MFIAIMKHFNNDLIKVVAHGYTGDSITHNYKGCKD